MRVNRKNRRNLHRDQLERVDIVFTTVIKSHRFVPEFNVARADWPAFDWTEIMESANLPQLREDKCMEISGFHTTRQWRKNFLFAFCHCCG
jgi:hypothetical protein